MNRFRLPIFALLLATLAATASAREFTDALGRRVEVPARIERVFAASPPVNVLLHALAPERMVALSFPVGADGRAFYPERLLTLPVAGGAYGQGKPMNAETVLTLQPDIGLAMLNAFTDRERVERAFARIGIPVAFLRLDTLPDWPAALRQTGALLDRRERAETLAADIEQRLAGLARFVAAVPESERPRVYYAEGPDGLATDCHRSFHTEAIELAGGYNVYRCDQKTLTGMERISLEQVIAFDPEVIVTHERNFFAQVRQDPRWRDIRAVRAGRVHLVPRWPHNWMDRPPSLMRALGAQWLASVFYPQRYPFQRNAEVRRFFHLFFALDPDEAQIDALFR